MPRRYIATYEYCETIKGERRDFVHESMFEAPDLLAAKSAAFRETTMYLRSGSRSKSTLSSAIAPP